jgi:hypothetical protein
MTRSSRAQENRGMTQVEMKSLSRTISQNL